jgi:hydrogenase maturation protease
MNFTRCDAIARAVLYEGYNLYPYRPSALKNRQRWTFGGVFPRDWAAREPTDRSTVQTQCLLRGAPEAELEIRVRCLHIVAREVGELYAPVSELPAGGELPFRAVPSLDLDGTRYLEWEEAREREIAAPALPVARLLDAPFVLPFAFAAEREVEPLRAKDGRIAALFIRTASELRGEIAVAAEQIEDGTYRATVRVENLTPLAAPQASPRALARRSALASLHALLGLHCGGFVSLLDPPPELAAAAAQCENQGLWPVLVGEDGATDLMLSAPIILYDYPKIAPESPGDLFDGTEIDEILTLRILTLTEAEKREIAAADPRSRALLLRSEALTAEELARLHGTFRDPADGALPADGPRPCRPHLAGETPAVQVLALRVGDHVRLKPKPGSDIMDVVLRDQLAVVEAIERDFEDRLHIAVTILDDPGRDLGIDRMPGHRFFFAPDEVELIASGAAR